MHMFAKLCRCKFVIPFARADEELDRLSWPFRLNGDRFASFAFQGTEESANGSDGVDAMFGSIEFREIALEEGGPNSPERPRVRGSRRSGGLELWGYPEVT